MRDNRNDEAQAEFKQLVEANRASPSDMLNYGLSLIETGQTGEAIEMLDRAVRVLETELSRAAAGGSRQQIASMLSKAQSTLSGLLLHSLHLGSSDAGERALQLAQSAAKLSPRDAIVATALATALDAKSARLEREFQRDAAAAAAAPSPRLHAEAARMRRAADEAFADAVRIARSELQAYDCDATMASEKLVEVALKRHADDNVTALVVCLNFSTMEREPPRRPRLVLSKRSTGAAAHAGAPPGGEPPSAERASNSSSSSAHPGGATPRAETGQERSPHLWLGPRPTANGRGRPAESRGTQRV